MDINTEYIKKIVEIGRNESCTDLELSYFLSNLPDIDLLRVLRDEYHIDTSHWTRRELLTVKIDRNKQRPAAADKELISFVIDLVKGIHIIEIKSGYRGSSTTSIGNLLGTLIEKDVKAFIGLFNWIASNGGNYYIESGTTFAESKKVEQIAENNRIEILTNVIKVHSDAVARKQKNRDSHTKISGDTQKLYQECKEKLQKMDDEKLIDSFNNDVGNPGWVGARARFHAALYEEFKNRSFDFSAIGNKNSLSFADKIKLIGKKIIKENMNNTKKIYKDLPTALRALADDLDSGRFEQSLQSEDSSASETPKVGQPEAAKTFEITFVPNKPKPSKQWTNDRDIMKKKLAEYPGVLYFQAVDTILKKWRKNPNLIKREIGVYSHWKDDNEENNKPLSSKEIKRFEETLKKFKR